MSSDSVCSFLDSLFSSAFSDFSSRQPAGHPSQLPIEWPPIAFQRTPVARLGDFTTQFPIKAVQKYREYLESRVSSEVSVFSSPPGPSARKKGKFVHENSSIEIPHNLKARWSRQLIEAAEKLLSSSPEFSSFFSSPVRFVAAPGGFVNVFLTEEMRKNIIGDDNSTSTVIKSEGLDIFSFSSLGRFSSIFKEKHGAPRQGAVFPLARGKFSLHPSIDVTSLDGLDEYSHVWLVFVFHRSLAAQAGKNFHQIPSKVKPPRLNGAKLGMFATRTPHRINAIGLSLARLDRIEGRTLFLSGVDLIEGTPILDLKPYHPADRVEDFAPPEWMKKLPEASLNVRFTDGAIAQLREILSDREKKLEFYENFEEVKEAVEQCLRLDPRTQHSKDKHTEGIYGVELDRLDVCFRIVEESAGLPTACVFKILHYSEAAEAAGLRPKLRTAGWFKEISQELDSRERKNSEEKKKDEEKMIDEKGEEKQKK